MSEDAGNEGFLGSRSIDGVGRGMRSAATLTRCYAPRLLNFWISLLGLVTITVVMWLLEPIGDSRAKVLATAVFAVMPILSLLDGLGKDKQSRQVDLPAAWLSVLSLIILFVVLADRADLTAVAISLISVLAWELYTILAKGIIYLSAENPLT